ncbi:putative DNA mismatch repair protein MutS [Cafeteria roenbergensis virus]|uniref:Putative DNA mismatch repair protein MutS n=1 Tax=Cafeteria roenbergensis virus (strain BV-PW1) TaxID=693272 RepID=E3T5Q7_CROVB|nr:putative DNA mismatch repair protein MutS [Cafeteria roenbergensis virus BV-PW1]ADO67520.1 putative DNA mismatch repair protein MutS [Cafeteria roenbergensis virus BV-PW1]
MIDYNNIKVTDYFQLHLDMKKKYGENTIILMQVGGFHEMYSTDKDGPNLEKIGEELDVLITKKNKNKTVSKNNPYMMGFPNHSLGKYVDLFINEGYLIVIVSQISTPPKPKRKITKIITPSTYQRDNSCSGNYLISVIIDESKSLQGESTIEIGLSAIELSIGQVFFHQGFSKKGDSNYSLDDAARFIQSFKPTEIIYANISDKDVIGKYNISQICEYLRFPRNSLDLSSKISPLKKITFQKRKFKEIFNTNLELIENMDIYPQARLSLFLIIYYIERINEVLLHKFQIPQIFYQPSKLYLGNRTLKQLNFSKEDKLYNVINKCKTPMGKRFFEMNINNPESDITELNKRYSDIKQFSENTVDNKLFMGIYDTDRIIRKIQLKTIVPVDIYKLHSSLHTGLELYTKVNIDDKQIKKIINFIEESVDLEKIRHLNSLDVKESFFLIDNKEFEKITLVNNKITQIMENLELNKTKFENLIDEGKFIKKSILKVEANLIDGLYISGTKKRGLEIEKKFIKSDLYKQFNNITFNYQKTTVKIKGDFLEKSFIDKSKLEGKLNELTSELFYSFIDKLEKYINELEHFSNNIAYYDFINSAVDLLNKNHYTLPKIRKDSNQNSFIRAKNLRHPLVELLLDEEYIPQNISLDDKIRGVMLFGVNSAGKSTLMKSVGISVLLAQIGYPVPAAKFEFYPYQSIFTRIVGNDDILKGLSSFMVEMIELNSILKRNNKNTLVIADELCRGTEVESAMYIVTTMIEALSKNNCSFITASHLHGLKNFNVINNLQNVKPFHLKVEYKNNNLIYDRKLCEGYGSNCYGIEVAKYILEDQNIVNRIYEISNQFEEMKMSKYNSEIVLEKCQICESKQQLETHHIIFQKDFNDGKHKKKLHLIKNNKSNLVVLCSKCHDEVDRNNIKIEGWKNSKLVIK